MGMWEGIVDTIEGGFGSDFDFDVINIGICNTCTRNKLMEGTLYYSHNNINNLGTLPGYERNDKNDTESKWDNVLKSILREQKINNIIDDKDE
jgi:hypothetical protein